MWLSPTQWAGLAWPSISPGPKTSTWSFRRCGPSSAPGAVRRAAALGQGLHHDESRVGGELSAGADFRRLVTTHDPDGALGNDLVDGWLGLLDR